MSRSEKAPVVETVAVRWGDQDPYGHVNNAKYFTYCETARIRYFKAMRMGELREAKSHGPTLAAANLNFRRQVRYPAELHVSARTVEIGNSSFKMEYEITQSDTGERVADGTGVLVWIDYETGKPIPLPEALKAEIRKLEGME